MRRSVIQRLLLLLRPQRRLMTISIFSRVVNQTLGVAIPAVAVSLVVSVAQDTSPGWGRAVALLVSLALVKGVFRYLEQLTGHAVAFRLLAELRNRVFAWLERLEPSRLEEERSGDLMARVSEDISHVEPFYAHTIAPVIAALVVPAITIAGLATWVDPSPALTVTPFVIAYLALVPWIGATHVARDAPDARMMAGESAAAVADVVQGVREIAVMGARSQVLAGLEGVGLAQAKIRAGLARTSAWRVLAGGAIAGGALVAVAIVSVSADLGLREVAVSVVLAWTVMGPLRVLEDIVADTEQSLAAAARLFELEDIPPQSNGDATRASGDVRFEVVTVAAGTETLVDALDLTVPAGSLLGVVGPSGSGKSTLVSTLVRHRDPSSGRVMLGGTDVRDLDPASLRAAVALVSQRPDLFHGTIASNLLIANPEAGDEELFEALARVDLLEWARSLEDGLHTRLGERGVGMSGGQLQRLALARAYLRDPVVLILDEATSELDVPTERAVLAEVYAERGGRTLIVVAHRMETVIAADMIAVMDRGRLVETGTHDELKTRDGLYSALWARHEDFIDV